MTTTELLLDQNDLRSLAAAVGLGITTPKQLAEWIGVDLIEDCLVLDRSPIYADDGNAEIEYVDCESAKQAAQEYVAGGNWGEIESTDWITVYTYRNGVNASGEIVPCEQESHTITLEPDEPECIDDDHYHVWKSPHSLVGGLKDNPGVQGHGGGVITTEVCMLCGCTMTTDTWAQNPANGEQGLTSVSYTELEYADEINERHVRRAKDRLGTDADQTGQFAFEWQDDDGDMVGADEDDLRDYGIALLLNEDAPKITGTLLSAES